MTEAEWLAATDPGPVLNAIRPSGTERKLRLLLVHSARLLWDRLTLPEFREAIEVAEQYIEGRASAAALKNANSRIYDVAMNRNASPERVEWWDRLRENGDTLFVALGPTFSVQGLERLERTNSWRSIARFIPDRLPGLFRELFGPLPFRPVAFDPAWRTADALLLARGVYDDRAFDRLPILADALQDAGCDADDLLNHLRDATAPHARGCWALDLVLGKE
jgi:hypothetical protein